MELKMHHLRDFIAVSRAQSLRGAARLLGLSQPALTRSLRDLERSIGAPLIDRHSRGVALTPAGQRFLLRAQAAVEDLRRGRDEARALADEPGTGSLAIGLSTAPLLELVPGAWPDFRQAHPLVRMRFYEGVFAALEGRLRDGTLDFYLGPRPERLAREFRAELFFRNERTIIARRGHPLRRAGTLAALVDAEWVLTGLRERPEEEFGELFRAHGLATPGRVVQVDSVLSILTLVAHSDALVILPRQWSDAPLFSRAIEAIAVREPITAPDIVRITRAGVPLTPLAEHWSDLLRRQVGARKGWSA